MIICFMHIFCHKIFKREHSLCIHIPCSGNQIFFICIFSGQLIHDQMAAIIQRSSLHIFIPNRLPSRRLYTADITALFIRHQFFSHARFCRLTSPVAVQRTVLLINCRRHLVLCKRRLVSVQYHVWFSFIFRHFNSRIITFFTICRIKNFFLKILPSLLPANPVTACTAAKRQFGNDCRSC